MTSILDGLATDPEALRKVTLTGPLVEAIGRRWPMWVLSAAAPSFNFHYAYDAMGHAAGVTADHVHPLRVLAAEQPGPEPRRWMQPSLIAVHLVLGADNLQYHERRKSDNDRLVLGWLGNKQTEIAADGGMVLRTRTEGVDASNGEAPFVQVAAQPLPAGLPDDSAKKQPGDWMDAHAAAGIIPVPPLRLVSGRIGIRARLAKNAGLGWLTRLGIETAGGDNDDWHTWPSVWLTPDGIEFEASLPFPGGASVKPLQGRVLLHPDPIRPGKFRLSLVEASDVQAWLAAWYDIVPAGGGTESLVGLKFAARRDGTLPAFSWQVEHSADGPSALTKDKVWVAARDCELLLTSPKAGGATDSVAALRLAELSITSRSEKDRRGQTQDFVEFEAQAGTPPDAIACTYLCTPASADLSVSSGGGKRVSLDIDAERLAQDLRLAYGLADPPAIPARRAPGIEYGAAYARPLLPAFVALDEGWLQLPVPNLGPLDTSNDLVLAGSGGGILPASVLNGFLRLRHNGLGEEVQSGYTPDRLPARDQDAPWSLTIERATSADARVRLLPRGDGAAARLVDAKIVLDGAVLSARGLLWLSADRPDAEEALPRLSAGPNNFFDARMQGADPAGASPSPLCVTIDRLGATLTRNIAKPATLDWNLMSFEFRTNSERWTGELLKPLEARRALDDAVACVLGEPPPSLREEDPAETLSVVRNHDHSFRAQLSEAVLHYRKVSGALKRLKAILAIAKPIARADRGLSSATDTSVKALAQLRDAQLALDEARGGLVAAPPTSRAPWPAVAWLRHPVLPLAATMPMTRAAAGGPRPLESRELFPFALLGKQAPDPPPPLLALASLGRRAGSPLPSLAMAAEFTRTPLPAWPTARALERDPNAPVGPPPNPERGIAMASIGVPGVELRVLAAPGPGEEPLYQAALRYDLPLLDEAFATATLPPPAGAPTQTAAPLDSVATALDWPLMAGLWARQERKHQNARVVQSYVCDYRAVDAAPVDIDILSLVRGLVWTAGVAFTTKSADDSAALSYGSVSVAGWTASGNRALAGYDGAVKPTRSKWQRPERPLKLPEGLELLGFSPFTFKVDEYELDSSMSGASSTLAKTAWLIERNLAVAGGTGSRLVSLADAETVHIAGQDFRFWFKDMLFKGEAAVLDAWDADMSFDSADNDARLAAAGGEWRFAPGDAGAAEATLRLGRSELPLRGLRLEPLRLTDLTLAGGRLASATLVCRLCLNPRGDGANFVQLVLSRRQPGDALDADVGLLVAGQPLLFNAIVATPEAGSGLAQRRVRVTATPDFKAGQAAFKNVSLDVEVAGVMIPIGEAEVELPNPQDAKQLVRVVQKAVPSTPATGDARLRIAAAVFCAGYALTDDKGHATLLPIPPALSWQRHIEIYAADVDATAASLHWTLGAHPSLAVFEFAVGDFDAAHDEGNGVLSLTINNQPLTLPLGVPSRLSAALLAKLGKASGDGAVALAAGHCELTLIQGEANSGKHALAVAAGVEISGGKAELSVTADAAGRWSGTAVLTGEIAATSDIRWPAILPDEDADKIPLPKLNAKNNDGRVRVLAAGGDAACHKVSWIMSDHRLSLGLTAALMSKTGTRTWAVPVVAHHRLVRGKREIAWTGIESLAVGRAAALVPRLPKPLTADAKTFASRYASAIAKGKYVDEREEGMLDPGLGAVATVLQGTLGRSFRDLFWSSAGQDKLLFAGGFLGQLATGGESGPLLRLPVLAGTGMTLEQSGIDKDGIELAWHDGPASRMLARTRPSAPTPANNSFDALGAALLAGSLTGPAGTDGDLGLSGAMLVEQFYATPANAQPASLQTGPFFLGAAVTVSAMLDALTDGEKREAASLSLVGGSLQRGDRTHALAASVAMQPAKPALPGSVRRDRLYVLGLAFKSHPWDKGLTHDADETLVPYLRRLAPAFDPDPAGFLLAQRPGGDLPRYLAGAIVPPGLEALAGAPGAPLAPAVFVDGRRGPCTVPATYDLLRWLAPPREGAAGPIRDAERRYDERNGERWYGSGIAGLARRMALPAHAGIAWAPAEDAGSPDLVWLSSSQVPVYLPLRIAGLRGAPVGWLQQAAPMVRLPTGPEVNDTLKKSRQPEPGGAHGVFSLQGFLPAVLSHSAVGERAGIVALRRSRLLTRLDGQGASAPAFDASYARFGAPAQAGSSWPRKLRTPRPGPLPENLGDAARDRRVQASYVRPLDAGSATIGSADVVHGGPGKFAGDSFSAWAIEVCAMPESASVVSERWDSALRLVCHVEVRNDGTGAFELRQSPSDFLVSALFGASGTTTARLKIGDAHLNYRWLEMLETDSDKAWTCAEMPAWRTATATVTLVLDARPTPQGGSAAFAPFAQALDAAGAHAAVELQWTVLPRSAGNARKMPAGVTKLGLKPTPYPTLVSGSVERPSLTLRLPLYPVRQSRGSLPLTPATLVFSDPAYDRELAGAPSVQRSKLEAASAGGLDARGELRMALYADRARVNRSGVLTLMVDIAYERRLDELAQALAEAYGALPGADLLRTVEGAVPLALVGLRLVPVDGPARPLRFCQTSPDKGPLVEVGTVYELPLELLAELDGTAARMRPGDVLQVDATLGFSKDAAREESVTIDLWHSEKKGAQAVTVTIPLNAAPHSLLNIVLTDEAVAEPPAALYLVLQRGGSDEARQLSVPLHAQSPLPRRLDLMDPARGFRQGLLRRHADFVWYLSSTDARLGEHALAPIKSDRNGQAYFPTSATEFLTPKRYAPSQGASHAGKL